LSLRRIDARAGDVKRLLWSPDGTLLFAGYAGEHGLRAFDSNGAVVFEESFGAAVYALAVTPRGLLAAAALDGTLRIYDIGNGRVQPRRALRTPARNPVSLAFSPDGAALAVGYFAQGKAPDVVQWESGESSSLPAPARMEVENLMAVAWAAHGTQVIAAGSYGAAHRRVPLVTYDAAQRKLLAENIVARLSIADLTALSDGRVAYAATDGSWGLSGATTARAPQLPDLLGASNLRVSDDGKRISWTLDGGANRVLFDIGRRELTKGSGSDLASARVRRGLFDAPSDWENLTTPTVNGARIALQADEVSRAVALFDKSKDAALGTSRALYRIGGDGRVVWRISTSTEVRAVVVTRDDRLIIAAMLDGTVRFWRAADGQELLGLLALRDGKWVMWTPGGFFDASVGADALVGWVINRADGGADYFPVARLRERFHQPRFLDRVLETLDFAQAARLHKEDLEREAAASAMAVAPAIVPSPTPTAPRVEQLPPTLATPLPTTLQTDPKTAGGFIEVPFTVNAKTPVARLQFEARVDGRPARLVVVARPPSADGRTQGLLKVEVPRQAGSVQVLARDDNGFSEPLSFRLVRPTPPPAVAAITPKSTTTTTPSAPPITPVKPAAESGVIDLGATKPTSDPTPGKLAAAPAPPAPAVTAPQAPAPAKAASATTGSGAATAPAATASAAPSGAAPSSASASASVATAPTAAGSSPPGASVATATTSAATAPASIATTTAGPATTAASAATAGSIAAARPPDAVRDYESTPRLPRLYVLAIGISEYARSDYRLGLAAKDARDFAGAMRTQQGKFYREVTTRVLVNQEAGRDALLTALKWLSSVSGKDDVTMLFIAGHGLNASSGKYYFLPHDGRHEDLPRTAVAEDEIRGALRNVAGRALFFVDTCFAGNVVGSLKDRNREVSRFVNDLASAENGVVVFASSSGRQVSEENDDWGNGAFTRALILGLNGRADLLRSGRITYKGLDYFVSEEVKRLTQGRQTPVSLSPWGVPDFTLASI
jgi:WD40 repeat protein